MRYGRIPLALARLSEYCSWQEDFRDHTNAISSSASLQLSCVGSLIRILAAIIHDVTRFLDVC
jgi:hypothetical protein